MAIKTNNKIFKSLRNNSNYIKRITQRKIDKRKEDQKKLNEIKRKQLVERKIEAEVSIQNKFKTDRALVSNNQDITINRTANGIITTTNVKTIDRRLLGKPVKTGVTTEVEGHVHKWTQYDDGSIIIHGAKHPKESRIKHDHDFKGSRVTYNQSSCYKDNPNTHNSCESLYGYPGVSMHKHQIKLTIS